MARKRKKSRSKKQRKAKRRAEAAATEAPKTEEDPAEDVVSLDDSTEGDEGVEDVLDEVLALDEDESEAAPVENEGANELEVVSLDDEEEITSISLDDEEHDREQLIAETLAFVAAEDGAPEAIDPTGEDGAPAASDTMPDPTGSEAEVPGDPAPDSASGISMTYDAVAALTEMQAEGLIDLPDDLVIDLGEATTDEQRDRLLAAALAHVEMQEARYRVPTETRQGRRWKGTAASALVTLAMLVAVAPPGILVPEPPAQLSESDRTYGVLVALLLQAQQIDAFRVREQRLPNDLSEVGTVLHDIQFVKSSNRLYQLVAYTTDGIAVVYDSAAPADIFQQVAGSWVTTQEGM